MELHPRVSPDGESRPGDRPPALPSSVTPLAGCAGSRAGTAGVCWSFSKHSTRRTHVRQALPRPASRSACVRSAPTCARPASPPTTSPCWAWSWRRAPPSPSATAPCGPGCCCSSSPPSPTCSTAPWPRPRARPRPEGRFFDSVADRLTDALLFGGVAWFLATTEPGRIAVLPLAVLAASMLISYERAKAESLGFDARGGLMERAERIIVLGFGAAVRRAADPGAVGDARRSRWSPPSSASSRCGARHRVGDPRPSATPGPAGSRGAAGPIGPRHAARWQERRQRWADLRTQRRDG